MKLSVKEICICAMFGGLMCAIKFMMQLLPNIHLVGVLIVALTVVYRSKALVSVYVFVFLDGIISGISPWWVPNLYVWTILWAVVILLPQKMPVKIKPVVYMVVCGLHGLAFGTLFAPVHALFYGLNWDGMIAWILVGIPFDIIHGVSNFIGGFLICPIIKIVQNAPKLIK